MLNIHIYVYYIYYISFSEFDIPVVARRRCVCGGPSLLTRRPELRSGRSTELVLKFAKFKLFKP